MKTQHTIFLKVNGQKHRIRIDPETPLLYVLRNDLGLKAAKFACGLEQCGACTILIDGRAVPSCRMTARSAQGHEITTLEGLGTPENLHPLQKAFMEEHAVQCGFCTSGMILTAKALLDRNPRPSDAEIKAAVATNLCRCGVYDRIRRAVRRAAGQPLPSPAFRTGMDRLKESPTTSQEPVATDGLAGSLMHTPDLDDWVRINSDGTVTLFTGKAELGQDIKTAIAMIGAEELDLSLDRIRIITADTEVSPNEGVTASSLSMETSGNAVRHAAAEARQILLNMAGQELNVPPDHLVVQDGTIKDPSSGKSTSYWNLMGGKPFQTKVMGEGWIKSPETYRLWGRSLPRLDLLDKVTGRFRFIQDLELPHLVHGRVIRPPDYQARLVSVDEETVRALPGVLKVVRDGSFLAVIAEREEEAVRAATDLNRSAVWETDSFLPGNENLFDYMLEQPDQAFLVKDGTPVDDPIPPIETPAEAVHTLQAAFFRPYHMHAALGPSAAVAQYIAGKLTVWSHTQGVYPLRSALAQVLEMGKKDIHVIHLDGPGCYGHNGADDAALDASLLARAFPGRPVSLKWTRQEENTWEPLGAASIVKMQASIDKDHKIIDWNHDVYGYTHMGRSRPSADSSGLLAAWHLARPFGQPRPFPVKAYHVGIHRNADPLYTFPRRRIVKHFLPDSPLRVSSLRGLGSYANIFAIESFMDELAFAGGCDPLEFRLAHLQDERARAVLSAVAEKGDWPELKKNLEKDQGCGLAFSRYKNKQCYTAVLVILRVMRGSGQIILERTFLAADVGQIVHAEAVSSQIEGAFVQSASWTLKEQVAFDQQGITSLDWHSYPILRFPEAPVIETLLLDQPGHPFLGVGEGAMGPAPAAIANALFQAAGVRLRRIPFTPHRVREALQKI
jgi:CO/xanthine dehydrogenase Mo-binding subunit/aerobic-type carbon monoxide dehydrogenase small subunit (CoxS/CutS family)